MKMQKETNSAIEEIQNIEQHLQGFLAQKQIAQVELQEITTALEELKKTQDDIYKVLSGVMLKSDKESLIRELEEKKKLAELRINIIEKQEKSLEERADKLKEKIHSIVGKGNNRQ